MKGIIGTLCVLFFLSWGGVRIVRNISFNQNCGGHLKRAADANTVELARTEMQTAINYIEENRLTDGYTSILYRTPDEDMGFWHKNLRAALAELDAISPNATQLERSNVLMKLRETLLDKGEHGEYITVPDGITVFPNNGAFAVWGWLATFTLCVAGWWLATDDYY